MPLSPPSSLFSEPLAAPSLPFSIFSHANDLIRMTSAGFVDPKTLGALHRQHDADAVLLQFNRGPRRLHASISSNPPARDGARWPFRRGRQQAVSPHNQVDATTGVVCTALLLPMGYHQVGHP